ncbi:hypothetical protein [Burkholderia gladioli]|uniref:hypothetical protein n=1 Tax=Burkholderia gladioli TaxID=28095 RepID=UPI00163F2FD5|nr:hypothetical protein [Burkholderia gladioli]
MNDSPICPWCRGPVLRSARRCWVCVPCATLHENAKRTGDPLPWADTQLFTRRATDEPTAPGQWPCADDELAPFEGWYNQFLRHHWGLARIAERVSRRYERKEAATNARRAKQAREAMADGPDAFRKRLERAGRPAHVAGVGKDQASRAWERFKLFATVAAAEVRTDIAAVLTEYPAEDHHVPHLVFGVGDAMLQRGEPLDPDEVGRYYRAVLPHVTPAELSDMGWAGGCRDEYGTVTDDALWAVVVHRLPTGLPDRVCKTVFDLLVLRGATPTVSHASRWCRSESEHVPDTWKQHLAHLLLDFTKQYVRRRIDAGEDLVALAHEQYVHEGILPLLEREGLDLAALDDNTLSHAIRYEQGIAERMIMARVSTGDDFSGGKPEHAWPPLHDTVYARGQCLKRWGPWLPDEQARQLGELALYQRIVDRLIDAGANVNFGDERGSDGALTYDARANPLLTAVLADDMGMAHHLMRRGARVDVALEELLGMDPASHSISDDTHQRRIAALMAIQQDELRAVADQVATTGPDEGPAAPARSARRRL